MTEGVNMMRTMTAFDVHALLSDLHATERVLAEMTLHPKLADLARRYLRDAETKLLIAALSDVSVEPIAPDALPERVMERAA